MNNNTINNDMTMGVAAPAGGAKRFRAGDEILGRYVVESELGQGGMGVVYLCLDKVGGVKVAVKGLPPEVSHNSDEMESVRENFQLVSELQHPNIAGVRTLEKDATTGDYYLVMAYARGMSLKQWLRQHGGKEHRAEHLNVLRQIASALDYAHNAEPRHIIHRDIKPENVMVDEHGNVAVLDFGLAAQVRSSLSRVSQIVTSRSGTPVYKSPEQWLAQAQRAPSDQYSLGVIAYQMFAGELPYDSDDIEILKHAVVFDPVPPIQGEDKVVNAVFAKALAKKPQERFASCAAFVDALGGAHPVAPARKPRIAAVLLGLLAVAALVGGGWWWQTRNRSNASSSSPSVPAVVATPTLPLPRVTPSVVTQVVEKVVERVVEKPAVTQVVEKVLGWEPQNAEALALKREAESHLEPKPGEEREFELVGGVKMKFCWCPAGSFQMGSDDGGGGEKPIHKVSLTRGFWMGKYEVTQRQWAQMIDSLGPIKDKDGKDIKANPSWFSSSGIGRDKVSGLDTSDFPVESVSWDDCDRVIRALNAGRKDGLRISLPTEAQWEYAAKGGEKSRGYRYAGGNDMSEVGWYYENSGVSRLDDANCQVDKLTSNKCRPHSVAEKKVENELGLVGMSGNVWEWCSDWYDEGYYGQSPSSDPQGPASGTCRVLRGGCWGSNALLCRSAYRLWDEPGGRNRVLGFRLVCSAGPRR